MNHRAFFHHAANFSRRISVMRIIILSCVPFCPSWRVTTANMIAQSGTIKLIKSRLWHVRNCPDVCQSDFSDLK